MRDPVMYRILKTAHHRTGDKWCIYPMYDFAHGQSDSIEGVTHSLCDIAYEDHRPLYDWFLDELGVYNPRQIEFARLNITYTVLKQALPQAAGGAGSWSAAGMIRACPLSAGCAGVDIRPRPFAILSTGWVWRRMRASPIFPCWNTASAIS